MNMNVKVKKRIGRVGGKYSVEGFHFSCTNTVKLSCKIMVSFMLPVLPVFLLTVRHSGEHLWLNPTEKRC